MLPAAFFLKAKFYCLFILFLYLTGVFCVQTHDPLLGDAHDINVFHNSRRLAVSHDPNDHRIKPVGFDWYSPWSSGTFLRHPHLPLVHGKNTLIIYSIVPNFSVRNFNFYLVAMIEQSRLPVESALNYTFTHCFVANGPLPARSTKLLGMLTSVLPSGHNVVLLNATALTGGLSYKSSRLIGLVYGKLDTSVYSKFVILDSKVIGPFFPPYWDHNKFQVWTDAYTSLLSDEVRVVGRVFRCSERRNKKFFIEKTMPSFEGPVALDSVGLHLAVGAIFEVFSEKFAYVILSSGYNVAALHGQPHGHDWRRWLQKISIGVNTTRSASATTSSNKTNAPKCLTEIPAYIVHPYEGLFMTRNRRLATGFETVYMKNVRKNAELKGERHSMLATLKTTHDSRVLVVFAYYEKSPQYKANLLFFLKTAVQIDANTDAPVDYVVVVNGEHTVQFPKLGNLQVILRNNTCLDFGSWGIALAQRTKKHAYFFVVNGSVKGPFVPSWFTDHWTRTFISQLQGDTGAVGLSVNCPDGVGRGVPHIMSMAIMFDRRMMEVAAKEKLFSCVPSYEEGLTRESDFSIAVLNAGMNLGSMQTAQFGMNFKSLYKDYLKDKGNIQSGCKGIDLDIFFKEGWYQGMSPNPMEFVFLKVSRDVNTRTTDIVTDISVENARYQKVALKAKKHSHKHILLFMHSMDMDGAPKLLFDMGRMLIENGYEVTFVAWNTGALAQSIAEIGAEVVLIKGGTGGSINSILDGIHLDADLVVFNTVVWADLIGNLPFIRSNQPKIMWILHENELSPSHTREDSNGSPFWYGMEFEKALGTEERLGNTLQKVDRVVFVADKVRAIWSKFDTGHFETFRGFVSLAEVNKRAYNGIDHSHKKKLLRSIGATKETFIITTLGTICKRKGQYLLAQALKNVGSSIFGAHKFLLLVVGAPSEEGGRGDSEYFKEFSTFVSGSRAMKNIIRFIPFSSSALSYIALSSLHMSVSSAEAFPLNVLEAMALGVPVMATRAGGSEEAFMRPGQDGLLLPLIQQREQLEENLVHLLKGKLDTLPAIGAAGKHTVTSRFMDSSSKTRLTSMFDRVFDTPKGPKGDVCIVVRTFDGHMADPIFSLRNMLNSLQNQHYTHWTAFVVNTDSKPMEGLYSLLSELSDPRFRVVDPPYHAEFKIGAFAETDRVVSQQCPRDSDWLLVTNGDNYYEPTFLNHLDLSRDVIAYDFYTRYSHILDTDLVGSGCKKFFKGPDVACKKNLLKYWHTDLGSYVLNFKRWLLEGRSFISQEKEGDGSADGHVAESLVYYDWPVQRVSAGCLFSHSPNMYHCLNNSFISTALWDAESNRCVVDPQQQDTLRQTHVPYNSEMLPYSMRLFQDRCMEIK